jgi:hypothetical protein
MKWSSEGHGGAYVTRRRRRGDRCWVSGITERECVTGYMPPRLTEGGMRSSRTFARVDANPCSKSPDSWIKIESKRSHSAETIDRAMAYIATRDRTERLV